MHVAFLIIGQGIAGSFLGLELEKQNRSFVIIDQPNSFSASRVASGIINPVTGRRIVKTWMIETLIKSATQAYKELEALLQIDCFRKQDIIDFFPTPQMEAAFKKRCEEDAEGAEFLSLPGAGHNEFVNYFQYDFGYGTISPCFLVDLPLLLSSLQQRFQNHHQLIQDSFNPAELVLTKDGIQYHDITSEKIIFCDGINSFDQRFFRLLPFAPNKGELLIAEIDGLPRNYTFKYGLNIVPWKENLFWIGASHEWKYENELPTSAFRERTEAHLKRILKLPFKIVDHWAAVRPATLERRPFIGLHPAYKQVGIFNGLGTKGCSLAPYFAPHFVNHLVHGSPLLPEADIARFQSVLRRVVH